MEIIKAFTDGACSGNPGPGGGGAIILIPSKKKKYHISGYEADTTNNRMELKAAIEAIRLATEQNADNIHIFSDSAYVVNAVKQNWLLEWAKNGWETKAGTDVKNKDLWLELFSLVYGKISCSFYKVKGHSGNKYNEEADRLAKMEIKANA